MNKVFLIILIFIVLNPSFAYAYLDPGTGSIILQAIIGVIAASLTAISIYWEKFKSIISKIFMRDKKQENKDKSKIDD
jgi:hypothetical protein|tara:strand:- start:193 stop:426 length:234 start_codon:yes stop_codon:yes gene_type:complete